MESLLKIKNEVIELLKQLISTPSLSKKEEATSDLIASFLEKKVSKIERNGNNVWAKSHNFDNTALPIILLNSHHDTVKPNDKWTKDPFTPTLDGNLLYGLGSNDAGGPLMALLGTFLYFNNIPTLPYRIVFAATAEEEISGKNGIASILPMIGEIDLGIIGEPTQMDMAIAEKGLMVLDCFAHGKAGHAAREEGENAIYKAMKDISWFQNFEYPESSDYLGPIKMSVTQIEAGYQHNVVPDVCKFVVDVRTNDKYSNKEAYNIICKNTVSEIKARSFRLNSSTISKTHPIVQRGITLGRQCYGSPTMSDQALIPYTTIKIGPGDSARSHTADEYIKITEIEKGIDIYISLLKDLEI